MIFEIHIIGSSTCEINRWIRLKLLAAFDFVSNPEESLEKLKQLPPFDFRTLLTVDYSQMIIAIAEEVNEIYQGEEEIKKFIDDKPIAKELTNLLFYQTAPNSTIMFLTLAIVSDFIDFPNNPGMSVVSRFVFNGFLPKNPHIPNISNWDQSTMHTYRQLLFAIIPTALRNGTLSKESLGLAGGNKKTYRRRKNNKRKTNRKNAKHEKRTKLSKQRKDHTKR
jgi:hypothetical protein